MTLPLISIILPTYNGVRYLEQSIMSCIGQTHQNWELIIVDDSSTDGTPEIIQKYVKADFRIRSIRHETNRKLPASLNTGFADAKGELLTWTSDDNLFRPEALATMAQFLDRHLDVGFVYCDHTIIDEKGLPVRKVFVKDPKMMGIDNCIGCCFLYRRHIAEKVGAYAEHLVLAEDYDYWLRISLVAKMATLHKDLYLYRRHEGSLTDCQNEAVMVVTERILLERLPQLHWLPKTIRAQGYSRIAMQALERKNYAEVRSYLLQGISYDPFSAVLKFIYSYSRKTLRIFLKSKKKIR